MKINDSKNVKIGCWWTTCCHLDLCEIKTQVELDDFLEWSASWFENKEPPHIEVWETQREALLEIRTRWHDLDTIAEIDAILASGP